MRKAIFFLNISVVNINFRNMWVLITVILKAASLEGYEPVYLKPILYDTIEQCELNLDRIHRDLIKLTYNYPVDIKLEYDENNKKYLKYTYKTDYTKPGETKYYHCKKI